VSASISQALAETPFEMKKIPECRCGDETVEVLASVAEVQKSRADILYFFVFVAFVDLGIRSNMVVQLDGEA
jgi:hypothetical protein